MYFTRIAIFIFLLTAFPAVLAQCTLETCSIDAVTVFEEDRSTVTASPIFYSFYHHPEMWTPGGKEFREAQDNGWMDVRTGF